MVGTPSGKLVQYTPEGEAKNEMPPPPGLDASAQYYPCFVQWLENDLFLVAYAQTGGSPEDSVEMFVIHRQGPSFTFTKFFDPLDTMGVAGRSGTYRQFAGLKDWGGKTKHLDFVMSGLASEVAIMHGQPASKGEVPKWEVLVLDETGRGIMPAAKKGVSDDTSCLGLAVDLTSERPIRQGLQGGIELPDLPPAPRLLAFSQEGVIISFDIQYPDGGAYAGMMKSGQAAMVSVTQNSTDSMDGSLSAAGLSGSVTETPKPAFGFGSFAPTAATTTPAKPSNPFGVSNGQSSTAAFGSSSKPSAFGASAFAESPTPSSTTPSGTPSTSAFGNAKPTAFGQSNFGQSSTPSAFGQTAFSQSAASSSGSLSSGSMGTPSFGSPAFGQPAKTTAPSAFGSFSTSSADLGFGAFGNKSAASTTGVGFGAYAFGQPAKPAAPAVNASDTSQSSPFGASGMNSAFGSGSGFGQSAFSGQASNNPSSINSSNPSGFAGFGSPSTSVEKPAFSGFEAKPAPPPYSASQEVSEDFGLGSFASALDSSGKTAVPGLDDSPPASPLGSASRPSGIEDDTPPSSPPLYQPVSTANTGSKPQAASSAFIKPATAFGSGSSFGAFGQPAGNEPFTASGSGSTPAALANQAIASHSSPSSSTAAFGQPSTPRPAASSGAVAFGQSSAPVAFAKSTIPTASNTGFGNITGGFGSFAAKPASPSGDVAHKTSGAGGFGGFAGAGGSVFGQGKETNAFSSMLNGGGKAFTQPAKSPFTTAFGSSPSPIATPSKKTALAQPGTLPVETVGAEPAPAPPGYGQPGPSTPVKVEEEVQTAAETTDTSTVPDAAARLPVASSIPVPNDEPEVEEPASENDEIDEGSETEVLEDDDSALEEDLTEEEEDDEESTSEHDDEGDDDLEDEGDQSYADRAGVEPSSATVPEEPDRQSSDKVQSSAQASGADNNETPVLRSKSKSPPPWVAQPTDVTSSTATSTVLESPGPSLLSRLGPPGTPEAPQASTPSIKNPAFNLKHAARTSSPLSFHPPQTPQDSTTPPVSPAKTPQSTLPAFSFFARKANETITPPSPQLGVSSSFPGAPRVSSSLGLGRPPSVPKPAAEAKSPPSLPSAFGSSNSTPPNNAADSLNTISTPSISAVQRWPDVVAESSSNFTIPPRPTIPVVPQRRDARNKSMAAVIERLISDLLTDIQRVGCLR